MCYVLAWSLAKPVRALSETVVRFGQGDLGSRTNSTRRDELGDLARAFDRMADRIQTLLTAERRLLQDVSHELRSPLARLRFAAELAKSSPDPQAAFARVNKEIDRLATLVGELLQVTRAEGDPEARNVSAIDLGEFLKSIVEDCTIEAEAKGCRIDLLATDHIVWNGDRELLHRAVENVLRNAIHHAPSGTTIEVDLRRKTIKFPFVFVITAPAYRTISFRKFSGRSTGLKKTGIAIMAEGSGLAWRLSSAQSACIMET